MTSDDRLSSAREHVTFELDQVASLPAQIERFDQKQSPVGVACFESFLLHARNLIDFLLGSHDPDDIQRTDFVERWNPPKSAATRRLRDVVLPVLHKRLAHLSWRRIEASDVRVDPREIAEDVMTVMGSFVQRLEKISSPHAKWFRDAFETNRRILGPLRSDRLVYSTSGAYDGVIVLRAWGVNEGQVRMSNESAMRVATLTQLAFGLNSLLDAGEHVDPDEVRRHIIDQTLFDWLEELYSEMMRTWAGLLRANPLDRLAVSELFEGLVSTADARRTFAIERNGLALLLAYCIEGVQQLNPFDQSSEPPREE